MADLLALAQRVYLVEFHFANNYMVWGEHNRFDVLRRMLTGAVSNCDVPNITRIVVLMETAIANPTLWDRTSRVR